MITMRREYYVYLKHIIMFYLCPGFPFSSGVAIGDGDRESRTQHAKGRHASLFSEQMS